MFSQHPAWFITPVNPSKVWSIAFIKLLWVYRHNKPWVFNQSERTYYLSYFKNIYKLSIYTLSFEWRNCDSELLTDLFWVNKEKLYALNGNGTPISLVIRRVCYHCTITTALLGTERSVRLLVSRRVPRRLIEQDIHRIIQWWFIGYEQIILMK